MDITLIKQGLKSEANMPLDKGLAATYKWIKVQYEKRKQDHRVGVG